MATAEGIVEIKGLRKRFGTNEVLKGIDLSVTQGEVIAVIGKSGSCKSTLLRCINGLEQFNEGSLTVDGNPLLHGNKVAMRTLRQRVGMIFQGFNLFPHLSVGRNVMRAPMLSSHWPSLCPQGVGPAGVHARRAHSRDRAAGADLQQPADTGVAPVPVVDHRLMRGRRGPPMRAATARRYCPPLLPAATARCYCPPPRLRLISMSRAHSGWSRKRGFSHSRSMQSAIAMNTREPQASRALDGAAPVGSGSWRAGGGASRPVIMPRGMTSSIMPSAPAAVAASGTLAGNGRCLSRATALAGIDVASAAVTALALPSGRPGLAPSEAGAAATGAPPAAGDAGGVDGTADALPLALALALALLAA